MCRLIAAYADRPVSFRPLLLDAPHALIRQSNRDRRGKCHDSGWGLGQYAEGVPVRVRSTQPAWQDPLYRESVDRIHSSLVLAHVRLATVGRVAERNCHPFTMGPWLFAHNGTLVGFTSEPEPLRAMIASEYLENFDGETDSEHIFRLLLSRLEGRTSPREVAGVVRSTVRELANLYPGSDADPTRLNLVLTNGHLLVAVRWGHWLYRWESNPVHTDEPRMLALASEAVDEGWEEVPECSVVLVNEDLTTETLPIRGAEPVQPLT